MKDSAERKVKVFGQVFTPPEIANFIVKWCIRKSEDLVLDPCAGDGIFVEASIKRLLELGINDTKKQVYAIERDPTLFKKLENIFKEKAELICRDFFNLKPINEVLYRDNDTLPLFKAVVGNPPYVERQRIDIIEKLRKMYPNIPALSDLYVYFIVHATRFLEYGGRLGFIVSDTWLSMNFGKFLRDFLVRKYKLRALLYFDEKVFPKLVRSVIILAEKVNKAPKDYEITFVRVKEHFSEALNSILSHINEETTSSQENVAIFKIPLSQLKKENSWLPYVLGHDMYIKLRKHPLITTLEDLARISIGLFTLANDFFILRVDKAKRLKIESEFLKKVIFSYKELTHPIVEKPEELRYYVLYCDKEKEELMGTNVLKYIELGERTPVKIRGKNEVVVGYHNTPRMKVASRKPWYNLKPEIEKRCIKPIVFPRRIYYRFIVAWNKIGAVYSDNFIGIEPKRPDYLLPLLAILNSSLTEYFARLTGHIYGGGVCDLRPSDVKRLPVVNLKRLTQEDLTRLEKAFLEYASNMKKEDLDKHVFSLLGFSEIEVNTILNKELEELKRLQTRQ